MSHDPSDCYEHGQESSCCSARVLLGMICAECGEHCDVDEIEQAEPERDKVAELEKRAEFNEWCKARELEEDDHDLNAGQKPRKLTNP